MRYITFVCLLFVSINVFSQDIDLIQKADTIYIYFDKEKSSDDLHLKTSNNKTIEMYMLVFPDSKTLSFRTSNIHTSKKDAIIKKKCFLEENKTKVIGIDSIHKYGYNKTLFNLYKKRKVIYIIDKKDMKRKKIILKKAYLENYIDSII